MKNWYKLDTAAKVFPSTVEKSESRVFRFYCELKEPVEPQILQNAVELALEDFPYFRLVLCRGMFWYYLERTSLTPVVHQEHETPCSRIYNSERKTLLFSVTYYKKRINLEIFHVLTDGAGALAFLKVIVATYLSLKHHLPKQAIPEKITSQQEETLADPFTQYSSKQNPRLDRVKLNTYILRGKRRPFQELNVIEGVMPVQDLLALAHQSSATLTEFLIAVLIKSIHMTLKWPNRSKHIVIGVPVNLRNYFESHTARNFFSIARISYQNKDQNPPLEEIVSFVSQQAKGRINREVLSNQINSLRFFETNLPMRIIPLFLKSQGLRFCNFFTKLHTTSALSNMGRITISDILDPYISNFGLISSTISTQIACCSFENNLTICFSSALMNTAVIRNFFQILSDFDLDITINSNMCDKPEVIRRDDLHVL